MRLKQKNGPSLLLARIGFHHKDLVSHWSSRTFLFLVKLVDESWRETAGYFCCGPAMKGHSPVSGRSSNTVYPVSPVVSAVEEI